MTARPKNTRIEFTYELLHQLYVVEDLSAAQIAKRLGYSKSAVGEKLQEHGFRKMNAPNSFPLTADELRHRYIEEGKSLSEVGTEIGWTARSVLEQLRLHGIPVRSKGGRIREVPREWLLEQYWGRNRTLEDLAVELHLGTSALRRMMAKLNVPRKPRVVARSSKSEHPSPNKERKEQFPQATRMALLRRDKVCRLCGSQDDLEAHHIVPVRLGADHSMSNGIMLCLKCHWTLHACELDWVDRLREAQGR